MSLNGLEATVINEAYQSALGEGGGWFAPLTQPYVSWLAIDLGLRFLLNYTTRDEVNLLGRGSGGLVEVKEAVDQYGEPSPLYGFINYRRRKVILKYLPEGTSRLLQGMCALCICAGLRAVYSLVHRSCSPCCCSFSVHCRKIYAK